MRVSMGDGTSKLLSEVRPGDEVVTVDPATNVRRAVVVKELTVHAAKNYAITRLMLVSAIVCGEREILLSSRLLEATPNHPMVTAAGEKKAGELVVGDKVRCLDEATGRYQEYRVWDKTEGAGGMQPVYNIVAASGSTFIMNGVMVMQKPQR
jgi:3-dehydroquinate synthase class II